MKLLCVQGSDKIRDLLLYKREDCYPVDKVVDHHAQHKTCSEK